jgi:hypothetical protein
MDDALAIHQLCIMKVVCNLFVEFIQRTYTDDVWVHSDPGPEHVPDDPPFDALQFTSDEVESVLQDLNVNGGSSLDGIRTIILKNCASAFAKPLSLLFNRSIATSVVPDIDSRKVLYVTPIFKKSRRINIEDCCCVLILSAILKHFRKNRSTITCIFRAEFN